MVNNSALHSVRPYACAVMPKCMSPLVTSSKGHFAAVIIALGLLRGSGSCWRREVVWVEAAMYLMRQWISEFQSGNGALLNVLCIQKEAVAGVIPCSKV